MISCVRLADAPWFRTAFGGDQELGIDESSGRYRVSRGFLQRVGMVMTGIAA